MDSNDVIHKLMKEIDKHEDLDNHPLRDSEAYREAVHVLGWDIDWSKVYEDRLGT